jgi:antitoxin MazE
MTAPFHTQPTAQGVLIPPDLLAQVGIQAEAEITIENRAIVVRAPATSPRQGWAEASRALAAAGDDALVWPEFANGEDEEWQW